MSIVDGFSVFVCYCCCNKIVTKKRTPLPMAKLLIWGAGYRITDASLRGEFPCHRVVTTNPRENERKTTDVPHDAFLEVAGCTTEEDVARLANRYGLLGTEQDYNLVRWEDDKVGYAIAEPVSTWLGLGNELREIWDDWQSLKDPKVDVRFRTFNLLIHDAFLPETPMGRPPGGLSAAELIESNSGLFPVQLHPFDELRVAMDEHDAALMMQEEAEKAFRTANGGKRDVKQARVALNRLRRRSLSRRPGNYFRMTPGEQYALEALEAALRRSDAAVRRLGLITLGLRVTKQLRLHGVVPALVKSPLQTLARVRQPRQPTMALQHYVPHLLALVWLQLAYAMSQQVEYRKCAGCPKYITIHPDAHRKHRKTCSAACRQRVWRMTPKDRRRGKKM